MNQTQPLRLTVKSSILARVRLLTIDKDYIEFGDNNLSNKAPTKFLKSDIKSFRCGIKWIRGYQFYIGRIYFIDIKEKSGRIIKLKLKSIYGIRKKLLADKYEKIITTLYDNFFDDIARHYLKEFDNNNDFELCGLLFSQKGIAFDKNSEHIAWENIQTNSYRTYYTISPKDAPNAYKAFEYLHDWDARTLYSVSRQILKNKGLHAE
ncbi:hypothetical protein QTN47_25395 [Danxiaibacter flavus]|uniref:Uncharacterized protein n=1 Tax=Danxiaibacter flavus TaxID=3049108 RepID=A0ABV3ZNY0_9BACT|nr:hypothetical protein QNM32_25400 [Chitinophagaceae bacterium DXS]